MYHGLSDRLMLMRESELYYNRTKRFWATTSKTSSAYFSTAGAQWSTHHVVCRKITSSCAGQ